MARIIACLAYWPHRLQDGEPSGRPTRSGARETRWIGESQFTAQRGIPGGGSDHFGAAVFFAGPIALKMDTGGSLKT